MMTPDHSILLVVDTPAETHSPHALPALSQLFNSARVLAIPAVVANYPAVGSAGMLEGQLAISDDCPRISFEPGAEQWRGSKLATALFESGRRQLLICGYWLEEGVSLLALHALQAGFDVYVAIDASPALSPGDLPTLQLRLVQHNVVVTTSTQILREWKALASTDK